MHIENILQTEGHFVRHKAVSNPDKHDDHTKIQTERPYFAGKALQFCLNIRVTTLVKCLIITNIW